MVVDGGGWMDGWKMGWPMSSPPALMREGLPSSLFRTSLFWLDGWGGGDAVSGRGGGSVVTLPPRMSPG